MANNSEHDSKFKISELVKALFVMGVGLAVVFSVSIALGRFSGKPSLITTTQERPVVSCSSDGFLSYQEASTTGKIVTLIGERQSMYVENGEFVNSKVILAKSETAESKVACGYLFIHAGTDQAIQKWEDVVVNPNGFGGHLKSDSAISVNEGKEYSEYIYNLNKIEYWPNRNRQSVNTADWASVFNVQQSIPFTIALNTENKSGFIENVSIVYKCWNPKTGEENKDCDLSVESKIDSKGKIE